MAIAGGLALDRVTWVVDSTWGGNAPCYLVLHAAMAIASGAARSVVLYRALRGRSGSRVGQVQHPGAAAQMRHAVGFDTFAQFIAMWARRYLIETGQDADDLGAIPVAQRAYALANERAVLRKPLSYDEYLAAPMIADPFRLYDCTLEIDGACAVVLTSSDRAKDLPVAPVRILSGAYVLPAKSGFDSADATLWPDISRNFNAALAEDLWGGAGLRPGDVDMAQIYDCFSICVPMALEGLGLAQRGAGIEMVRSGATGADGTLPVNTGGGLLAEGYLHGMNTLAEAVLQLQGRGATAPAKRPETCVVTSGAMMDGSGLVLARA